MTLWWRNNRPEVLAVQALHDGKSLAIQLIWTDATNLVPQVGMRSPEQMMDVQLVEGLVVGGAVLAV